MGTLFECATQTVCPVVSDWRLRPSMLVAHTQERRRTDRNLGASRMRLLGFFFWGVSAFCRGWEACAYVHPIIFGGVTSTTEVPHFSLAADVL